MKKMIKKLLVSLVVAASTMAANASVVATVNVGGGAPYMDDYNVFFGLGSTATPTWSQQVAAAYNGGGDFAGAASLDITANYSALGGQTWWVLVSDVWGGNYSYITNFSINTGTETLFAAGTPMYIADNGHAYAFITTQESSSVPEPGSLALFGLGLAGLAAWRRKITQT